MKNVKKKLDEMLPTLSSPIPSPDINAPSPSPDSDLELPGPDNNTPPAVNFSEPTTGRGITNNKKKSLFVSTFLLGLV